MKVALLLLTSSILMALPILAEDVEIPRSYQHLIASPDNESLFQRFQVAWQQNNEPDTLEPFLRREADSNELGSKLVLARYLLQSNRQEEALEILDTAHKNFPEAKHSFPLLQSMLKTHWLKAESLDSRHYRELATRAPELATQVELLRALSGEHSLARAKDWQAKLVEKEQWNFRTLQTLLQEVIDRDAVWGDGHQYLAGEWRKLLAQEQTEVIANPEILASIALHHYYKDGEEAYRQLIDELVRQWVGPRALWEDWEQRDKAKPSVSEHRQTEYRLTSLYTAIGRHAETVFPLLLLDEHPVVTSKLSQTLWSSFIHKHRGRSATETRTFLRQTGFWDVSIQQWAKPFNYQTRFRAFLNMARLGLDSPQLTMLAKTLSKDPAATFLQKLAAPLITYDHKALEAVLAEETPKILKWNAADLLALAEIIAPQFPDWKLRNDEAPQILHKLFQALKGPYLAKQRVLRQKNLKQTIASGGKVLRSSDLIRNMEKEVLDLIPEDPAAAAQLANRYLTAYQETGGVPAWSSQFWRPEGVEIGKRFITYLNAEEETAWQTLHFYLAFQEQPAANQFAVGRELDSQLHRLSSLLNHKLAEPLSAPDDSKERFLALWSAFAKTTDEETASTREAMAWIFTKEQFVHWYPDTRDKTNAWASLESEVNALPEPLRLPIKVLISHRLSDELGNDWMQTVATQFTEYLARETPAFSQLKHLIFEDLLSRESPLLQFETVWEGYAALARRRHHLGEWRRYLSLHKIVRSVEKHQNWSFGPRIGEWLLLISRDIFGEEGEVISFDTKDGQAVAEQFLKSLSILFVYAQKPSQAAALLEKYGDFVKGNLSLMLALTRAGAPDVAVRISLPENAIYQQPESRNLANAKDLLDSVKNSTSRFQLECLLFARDRSLSPEDRIERGLDLAKRFAVEAPEKESARLQCLDALTGPSAVLLMLEDQISATTREQSLSEMLAVSGSTKGFVQGVHRASFRLLVHHQKWDSILATLQELERLKKEDSPAASSAHSFFESLCRVLPGEVAKLPPEQNRFPIPNDLLEYLSRKARLVMAGEPRLRGSSDLFRATVYLHFLARKIAPVESICEKYPAYHKRMGNRRTLTVLSLLHRFFLTDWGLPADQAWKEALVGDLMTHEHLGEITLQILEDDRNYHHLHFRGAAAENTLVTTVFTLPETTPQWGRLQLAVRSGMTANIYRKWLQEQPAENSEHPQELALSLADWENILTWADKNKDAELANEVKVRQALVLFNFQKEEEAEKLLQSCTVETLSHHIRRSLKRHRERATKE
jgi:hypothetical protein